MSELALEKNNFSLLLKLLKKILASMDEVIMEFKDIFPKYEKLIDSILHSYPRVGEFEDMKQDILITIARKCQTILNPQSVRSWVGMVIRNYVFDKMRAKREKAQVISFSEITDDPEIEIENMLVDFKDPATLFEDKELKRDIEKNINKLDNPWKTVLRARHIENLTYKEIAEKYGIKLGTVKSQILRGRRRFKDSYG